MAEDSPLFGITTKSMKFWGLLVGSRWRRYYCLVSCFTVNLGQVLNLLITKQSFDIFIRDAYIAVLWSIASLRAIVLIRNCYKFEEFEEFIKEIKDTCIEIEKNESPENKQTFVTICRSARKVANFNMITGIVAIVGLSTFPLFGSLRVLPYNVYVPVVDKYQSPWYEILYLLQVMSTVPGNWVYIPFTNLIVAFIMFGVLRCKILQCHLKNLGNLSGQELSREVNWCIRYQVDIIRYVNVINSLTSFIYFVEFMASSAILCALIFLLNMVKTLEELVVVSLYILLLLSQVLSVYLFANELCCESVNIAVAAYGTDWYNFDIKNRKAMILLILQAQQPCAIMVGNMYPMSLQLFQTLLNTSYSYFTLLRGVYN